MRVMARCGDSVSAQPLDWSLGSSRVAAATRLYCPLHCCFPESDLDSAPCSVFSPMIGQSFTRGRILEQRTDFNGSGGGPTMRILTVMVLTALLNSTLLTGCAPSRALMRFPPDTSAESVDLLWNAVLAVPAGSSLDVDLRTGDSIQGRFRSANDQTLILVFDGGSRSVPRAEIRRVLLDRGNHAKKGALRGLGIGAVTGLATSSLQVAKADYPVDGEGIVIGVETSLFGLIGTGIGALIGVFSNDRTVIYETPVSGLR